MPDISGAHGFELANRVSGVSRRCCAGPCGTSISENPAALGAFPLHALHETQTTDTTTTSVFTKLAKTVIMKIAILFTISLTALGLADICPSSRRCTPGAGCDGQVDGGKNCCSNAAGHKGVVSNCENMASLPNTDCNQAEMYGKSE